MTVYDTVIIFKPDFEDRAKVELNKLLKVYKDVAGTKRMKLEDQGVKKLAYEIKSHKYGYYVILHHEATPVQIDILENLLRVNKDVIKFMTIKIDMEPEEIEEFQSEEEKKVVDVLDIIYGLT